MKKSRIMAFLMAGMIALTPMTDLMPASAATTAYAASAKLSAPKNISISKTTTNSVKLTWDEVNDADAYRVYKYNSSTKKYEKYKDVKNTYCTVKKLKAGTKYKFKVCALISKKGKYVTQTKSSAISATTESEKLEAPELKVESATKNSIKLSWNAVKGADSYYIYKKNTNGSFAKCKSVTGTSCEITGLKPDTKYQFKICAVVNKKKQTTSEVFTAQTASEPIVVKGTGDSVTKKIKLSAPIYKVKLSYTGKSNFIAVVYDNNGDRCDTIANEIDNYTGEVLFVPEDGITSYYIEVQSSGNWTISFETITEAPASEFKGTNTYVSGFFTLDKGVYVVDLNNKGESNFIVQFYDSDGNRYYSLANEIGDYSGKTLFVNEDPETKYCISVLSDGNWKLSFNQPTKKGTSNLSGKGDTVTPWFSLDKGTYIVELTNKGDSNFIAVVYDDIGERYSSIANEIGDYEGQCIFKADENGRKYCIKVISEGEWTIDFGVDSKSTKVSNKTDGYTPPSSGDTVHDEDSDNTPGYESDDETTWTRNDIYAMIEYLTDTISPYLTNAVEYTNDSYSSTYYAEIYRQRAIQYYTLAAPCLYELYTFVNARTALELASERTFADLILETYDLCDAASKLDPDDTSDYTLLSYTAEIGDNMLSILEIASQILDIL